MLLEDLLFVTRETFPAVSVYHGPSSTDILFVRKATREELFDSPVLSQAKWEAREKREVGAEYGEEGKEEKRRGLQLARVDWIGQFDLIPDQLNAI